MCLLSDYSKCVSKNHIEQWFLSLHCALLDFSFCLCVLTLKFVTPKKMIACFESVKKFTKNSCHLFFLLPCLFYSFVFLLTDARYGRQGAPSSCFDLFCDPCHPFQMKRNKVLLLVVVVVLHLLQCVSASEIIQFEKKINFLFRFPSVVGTKPERFGWGTKNTLI